MNAFSPRTMIKRALMRRFDIERVELDRLICRHAMVTLRTAKPALLALLEGLAPVTTATHALIRMGAPADGGYLVPDDLEGIAACFSPGVDYVSKFEKDCAQRGMKVFLADKSVEAPAETHNAFAFEKKFVGALDNEDFMTMDHWVQSSFSDKRSDLLLQMDIEGSEYEALLCMSNELMRRFRIMVVEFHGLEQLWSRPFFNLASRTFEKLLQTHRCVHIHPNNCSDVSRKEGIEIPSAMEFTFLREDRFSVYKPATVFPHPLDADCTVEPPLILPPCWYGGQEGKSS